MAVVTERCPPVLSDERLLERFLAGEKEALEELFRRYRGLAYRVAYRLLGNEADALDAVQDGFIKAMTHLHTFHGRSAFKTWLLRVISNAALDLGRQRARRETISLDASDSAGWQSKGLLSLENPGLGVEQQELRRLLDQALATLPNAQRQTFVLHTEGELNYREVAETLGISIGTVMSRLFYARQKLRAYLARRIKL